MESIGIPQRSVHINTFQLNFMYLCFQMCLATTSLAKSVPVPYVPLAERYLVGRVGPAAYRSNRCIVRYGCRDVHQDIDSFETELVEKLADFSYDWHQTARHTSCCTEKEACGSNELSESRFAVIGTVAYEMEETVEVASVSAGLSTAESVGDVIEMGMVERRVRFAIDDESEAGEVERNVNVQLQEEIEDLLAARQAGTAFILGHSHVRAKQGSSLLRRLAINFGYNFLRRNCRGPHVALKVPPGSLLEVGMVYVV